MTRIEGNWQELERIEKIWKDLKKFEKIWKNLKKFETKRIEKRWLAVMDLNLFQSCFTFLWNYEEASFALAWRGVAVVSVATVTSVASVKKRYNIGCKFDNFVCPFLQSVTKKKTHLAVFETCIFRVYLRNYLSYKKVIYILVWRAFRWKNNFSSQLKFAKTLFC